MLHVVDHSGEMIWINGNLITQECESLHSVLAAQP
jgi:hypothetical protein